MRKMPTPEQKAAAAERRKAFYVLANRIGAMPEEERKALAQRAPVVTVEGRPLSVANQALVILQREDATVVGGFAQWLRAGRAVRKGERGIMIWVPIGKRPETAEAEQEDVHFVPGTVFDVSQTEPLEAG